MDVHFVERSIVLQSGIGLQILCQFPRRFLIKQALMKIPTERQLLLHMEAGTPNDPGIIGYLLPIFQCEQNGERIFGILLNQVFQGDPSVNLSLRGHIIRDFRILNEPCAVSAPHLKRNTRHLHAISIHHEVRVPAIS